MIHSLPDCCSKGQTSDCQSLPERHSFGRQAHQGRQNLSPYLLSIMTSHQPPTTSPRQTKINSERLEVQQPIAQSEAGATGSPSRVRREVQFNRIKTSGRLKAIGPIASNVKPHVTLLSSRLGDRSEFCRSRCRCNPNTVARNKHIPIAEFVGTTADSSTCE